VAGATDGRNGGSAPSSPSRSGAERIAAQDGNCQTDAWAQIVVATVPAGSNPSAIAVNQFVTAPRLDSWL
jgi:hypothetical protein